MFVCVFRHEQLLTPTNIIFVGMPVTRVQILDVAVCISHIANTLGKAMNLTFLPPTIGK